MHLCFYSKFKRKSMSASRQDIWDFYIKPLNPFVLQSKADIFTTENMLWALIRSTSVRCFYWVPTTCFCGEIKQILCGYHLLSEAELYIVIIFGTYLVIKLVFLLYIHVRVSKHHQKYQTTLQK